MDALFHLLALGGLLFVSQLSPGPDFLLIFRTSLSEGWRAGATLGLGISLGFLVQVLLVCSLGSQILEWQGAPYLLGVAGAYLAYLAWGIFPLAAIRQRFSNKAAGHDQLSEQEVLKQDKSRSLWRILLQGFICNITNAKCLLFLLGLCLGGLSRYADVWWYAPALVAWFFFVSALGWAIWAGLMQWAPLIKMYHARVWLIDSIFSLLLTGVAIMLWHEAWVSA